MGMFREACEIISKMWNEDRPVFEGKYYTIDGPINQPKGAHNTPPTLWIAGEGEKVTLKLVASFADGCNVGGGQPGDIKRKIEVLHRHCEDVGRDPSEITVSTNFENVHLLAPGEDPDRVADWSNGQFTLDEYHKRFKVLTADELIERVEQVVDAGASYVILNLAGRAFNQEEMIYRFAKDVCRDLPSGYPECIISSGRCPCGHLFQLRRLQRARWFFWSSCRVRKRPIRAKRATNAMAVCKATSRASA